MFERIRGHKDKMFDQKEDQTDGSDDEKCADACESELEGAKIDDGKGSGP